MLDVRAALKSLFGHEPVIGIDPLALIVQGSAVSGYCVAEQVGDLIFRGVGLSEVHALWDLLFSVSLAAVTSSADELALPDALLPEELYE